MIYKLNIKIKNCNNLEDIKKYINVNKIKIIFFAETHGILDELKIQDKIISILKPTCYLYELLEEEKIISNSDFIKFLKKDDSERFSVISSFGELKPTIRLTKKYNLPTIGCDIKNMCRKNKDFLKEINDFEEEKIMLKREERQSNIIKKELIRYGPQIFVSIGAFHLRKDSLIFKKIKSKYILISPLVDKRRLDNLKENFDIKKAKEIDYIIESSEDDNKIKN